MYLSRSSQVLLNMKNAIRFACMDAIYMAAWYRRDSTKQDKKPDTHTTYNNVK